MTAEVRFTVPRPISEAWTLLGDLARYPELFDEIDCIEKWPHGWRIGMRGATALLSVETQEAPAGFTARFSDGSLFGLKLPQPKDDILWMALEVAGSGTQVSVGRSVRFGSRLAHHAGRALVPLQQRSLDLCAVNAMAILAPEVGPDGELLHVPRLPEPDAANVPGGAELTAEEVSALQRPSFRAHRAAYVAGSAARASSHEATRVAGELSTKLVTWHAEHKEERSWARVRDEYPDAGLRLAQQMLAQARRPAPAYLVSAYLIACRHLGLRSRTDLTAALGVCHLGYAARVVEERVFPNASKPSKSGQKVAGVTTRRLGSHAERLAAGALVFSRGDILDDVSGDLLSIPGAADPVRLMLSEMSGMLVDRSPDLEHARSRSVRKISDAVWVSGYATRIVEHAWPAT